MVLITTVRVTVLVVLSLHTVPVPVQRIDSIKTNHDGSDNSTCCKVSIMIMIMINWREYRNVTRMKETATR